MRLRFFVDFPERSTDSTLPKNGRAWSLFPDCEVGAEPPFGNLYGLPVYVDRELAKDETIVVEAGTYTETISLRFADYQRLVQPTIADLSRQL